MKKLCLLLLLLSQIILGKESYDIFDAIKEGNNVKIKEVIKKTKNLNTFNKDGISPLTLAIVKDNKEIVKELIKNGANVNLKDSEGFLIIEMAIHYKKLDILKILVENNIDINLKDDYEQTPLEYAIITKSNDCFDYLLSLGAIVNLDPDSRDDFDLAEEEENYHVIKKLLEKGFIPVSDNLLIKSLESGQVEIAKLLIDYSSLSTYATESIIEGDYPEVQEYLFKKFPNLLFVEHEAKDSYDESEEEPYACKLLRNNKALFIQLMENYPKIAEFENVEGQNAILFAAANGDYDLARFLLSKGVNFNTKDFEGNTALMLAARSGNSKLTQLFIEKGLNVNNKNNKGETALMLSAKSVQAKYLSSIYITELEIKYSFIDELDRDIVVLSDYNSFAFASYIAGLADSNIKLKEDNFVEKVEDESKVCDVLLKNGANLEEKNFGNGTALTYAVIYNDTKLVKYFIEKGANVNNVDKSKLTNCDFALVYANSDILELLLMNKGYFGLEENYKCNPLALVQKFSEEESQKILKLLIKNGFSPNKKSIYGWDPIHSYVGDDLNLGTTKFLVLNKADINSKNIGKTPLSIAVECGAIDTVKYLVSKGADLKYKTEQGQSLLSLTDDSAIIKYLKSKGVK